MTAPGTTRHLARRIVAILGAILATSCSSTTEPEAGWYAGAIVARDIATSIGGPPTVHVKERAADECGIIFLVRPDTRIRYNGVPVPWSLGQDLLGIGSEVRVSTRIVLNSCPAQAYAIAIQVAA